MKAIGIKCGWVVPKKERRVLMLLRNHFRERDHEFVAKSPIVIRQKPGVKIHVTFAPEKRSAFKPRVRTLPPRKH